MALYYAYLLPLLRVNVFEHLAVCECRPTSTAFHMCASAWLVYLQEFQAYTVLFHRILKDLILNSLILSYRVFKLKVDEF